MKPGLIAAVLMSAALGGCGLKGPLYLPEKSGKVVVRGPATPASAPTTPSETPESPGSPAESPPPLPDPQIPQ